MQNPLFLFSTIVGSDMHFNDFANQIISVINLREKTRNNYKSIFNCHIKQTLENVGIGEVNRNHLQTILQNLPPHTRSATLAVIKTIFREAMMHGLVDHSPAADYRIPTPIVGRKKFLTWEELKVAELGRYKTQIHFLALHGLRWGEAVVLNQGDIRGNRVHINRSVHGDTKSQSGVRVVPLISEFVPFPKSPKTLRKVLDPFGVHIHSLRHTYAYILKSQGVHVTTAQKLLGHSDVKVTLKVYTQVLDDEIDVAGDLIRLIS
jgi:integrase